MNTLPVQQQVEKSYVLWHGDIPSECLKTGIALRKLVMYVLSYVLPQNFALEGCSC